MVDLETDSIAVSSSSEAPDYGAGDASESGSEVLISEYDPEPVKTIAQGLNRVLSRDSVDSGSSDGEVLRRARSAGRRMSWHQRPSLLMLGAAVFMNSFSSGFAAAPTFNLTVEAVCYKMNSYGTHLACDSELVQKANATLQQYLSFTSIFSVLASGWIGRMSDLHGRKIMILYSFSCDFLATLVWFFFLHPAVFREWGIILACVILSMGSNITIIMGLSNSYVVDVVDEKDRMNSMGKITAASSLGGGLGPLCSSFFSKSNWMSLRMSLVMRFVTLVLIWFFLPESRPSKLRHRARRQSESLYSRMQAEHATVPLAQRLGLTPLIESVKSVKLLWITRRDDAGRVDKVARINFLLLLVGNLFIYSASAMTTMTIMLYATFQFGWPANTLSLFMGGTMLVQSVVMMYFNPWLHARLASVFAEDVTNADHIDITYLVTATSLDFFAMLSAITARNSLSFMLVGLFQALSSIGTTAINTAFVKYCPSSGQTGEFYGAIGLLRNVIGMVAPAAGLAIYSASISFNPQLIFYVSGFLQLVIMALMLSVRVRK